MSFNEANAVENLIRDLSSGGTPFHGGTPPAGLAQRAGRLAGLGWHFVPCDRLPRRVTEVFVESYLRDALVRLNPDIAAQPGRADEVLYRLRAVVLSVRSDGLIRANEELTAWLRGERSMPFGPNS